MMNRCMSMQNGFQFSKLHEECLLFLFPGWNIDSYVKYIIALVGIFCLGLSNEVLSYIRHLVLKRLNGRRSSLIVDQLSLSLLYGIHMLLAYCMMLLVMTYDVGFFVILLLGLIFGHFMFGIIRSRNDTLPSENTPLIGSSNENSSLSTPCCRSLNWLIRWLVEKERCECIW